MPSTLTNLLTHIVFSTKERHPMITDQYRKRLYAYVGGIIRHEGAEPLTIGGTEDHLHIAVKIKSSMALSDLVRKIKANSSRWINEKRFCQGKFAWQTGYSGFSVSASQIEKVRSYIENQIERHKTKTFKAELTEMLDKHMIEYDSEYLWE